MIQKRKVFLYGRVSTDQQTGGLESQVRALKEYCAMNKITEYEIFTDENQSGTKASRPALDRMMAAVRNGECSCLVVYSFSRFARSVTHLLQGLEELKRQKTSFVSLTERIETDSPIGKAVFVIIGAIAQLERDLICDAIKKCRCSRNWKKPGAAIKLIVARQNSLTTGDHLHGKLYRSRCA